MLRCQQPVISARLGGLDSIPSHFRSSAMENRNESTAERHTGTMNARTGNSGKHRMR